MRDAGSQTTLAVVFRAIPELDPAYLALVALLRVLDDGMSTRLHYTLADQKGLAYSIHAAIEPLADTALFEITGATANAKVPSLVRELLDLLDGLRRGHVGHDELAKARVRYRYETLASIDDSAAMAGWVVCTALYYRPPALSERLAQMEKIGVDDVVRKPVHPREILARVAAIRRRLKAIANYTDIGPIRVFADGRDPEITGEVFALPRRERRILEYLVANRGRRVSKSQIFNAIYGIFDEDVEENVVESHISKLRKKLRKKLGFDPIDSKRFLGYCIDWN